MAKPEGKEEAALTTQAAKGMGASPAPLPSVTTSDKTGKSGWNPPWLASAYLPPHTHSVLLLPGERPTHRIPRLAPQLRLPRKVQEGQGTHGPGRSPLPRVAGWVGTLHPGPMDKRLGLGPKRNYQDPTGSLLPSGPQPLVT